MPSEPMSRRRFLETSGRSAAALVLAGQVRADAQQPEKSKKDEEKTLAKVFEGITLTDQYGKEFKPAELFKDKQCIVLFGYGGCPMCEKISDTVAAVQQELIRQGKNVPIVVVSVQPEQDSYREEQRDAAGRVTQSNPMRRYVASYYVEGVRQFQDEVLPDDEQKRREAGERSYDGAKDKPQGDRILHVVCPPKAEDAQEIERRIGLIFNENDPKVHSSFLTLFDKGVATKHYRGLPSHRETDEAKYAATLARQVSEDVQQLSRGR